MDEAAGYFWEGFTGHEDLSAYNFDLVERLTEDIKAIGQLDAVVALDGWTTSSGARAETAFAFAVGKPVFEYEEASRINGFRHSLQPLKKGLVIGYYANGSESGTEWEDGERVALNG